MQSFDTSVPNSARIYDYVLGGKDNYEADRAAGDKIISAMPQARATARDNRLFLKRAVRCAAQHGIDQFLDLGSGLPTAENTHEIAHAVNPDARVAYIDYDPLAVAYSQPLLEVDANTLVMGGDLREPEAVLSRLTGFLDLDRPVAVMLIGVLHFSEDPVAGEIVARFMSLVPAGSCLILSHGSCDSLRPDQVELAREIYERGDTRCALRSRDEITALFAGLELAEPGVVGVGHWPVGSLDPAPALVYCGVAWKPPRTAPPAGCP